MEQNKCITGGKVAEFGGKIKPTNSPECCIYTNSQKRSAPRWEPKAEDFMADDWRLTE